MSPKMKKLGEVVLKYFKPDNEELNYSLYELRVDSNDPIPVFSGVKLNEIKLNTLLDYVDYNVLMVNSDDKEVKMLIVKPQSDHEYYSGEDDD